MPHPVTKSDILAALAASSESIAAFFTSQPDAAIFTGDSERWGPAHHLLHLTMSSAAVRRGLGSGALPFHPTSRSRTYAEVRDAAAASLSAAPRDRLLDMGRVVVIEPGATRAGLVDAFVAASADLRAAAAVWNEEELDRRVLKHPLLGELTVREMLFFCIVHERHHLRQVQARLAANPSDSPSR